MFGLEPWHIILVVVVFVVLFGAKRLPELGKGIGEGWKGFKEGLSNPDGAAKTDASATPAAPAAKPTDELKPPPAA